MKIVSVVPNSAVRDARVMKQARTLKSRGYEVSVVGIQEGSWTSFRSITHDGIYVYRAPVIESQQEIKKNILKALKTFGFLVLLMLVISCLVVLGENGKAWILEADKFIVDSSFFTVSLYLGLYLFIIGLIYYFFFKVFNLRLLLRRAVKNISVDFLSALSMYARRKAMRKEVTPIIQDLSPDMIYCHECMSIEACLDAKELLNIPVVYDAHEFYDNIEGANSAVLRKIYASIHRENISRFDMFVVTGKTAWELYQNAGYQLPTKVVILPNSIEVKDVGTYDGRLHQAANVPLGQNILLYQGGVSTHRRVDEVVKAAENIPENWTVVVMGAGKERSIIEGISDDVNSDALNKYAKKLVKDKYTLEYEELYKGYLTSSKVESEEGGDSSALEVASDLGMASYFQAEFLNNLKLSAKKTKARLSLRQKKLLEDEFSSQTNALYSRVNKISDAKVKLKKLENKLAEKLALEDIIANYGAGFIPRVSVIDPVPHSELLEWTQGASIGVIPYPISSANHWGAAPNKLWEYPTAGIPLIATPSVEMYSVISKYQMGWMLSADPDAAEIANIINGIGVEDIHEKAIGCARFVSESNWEQHTKGWLQVIDNILDGK